jgi:hypothetical protein
MTHHPKKPPGTTPEPCRNHSGTAECRRGARAVPRSHTAESGGAGTTALGTTTNACGTTRQIAVDRDRARKTVTTHEQD